MQRFVDLVVVVVALAIAIPAHSQNKPLLAVMDIQDRTGALSAEVIDNLTEYLRGLLAESGKYTVIDRSRQAKAIKDVLQKERKETHKACYERSCQVPVGRILAADQVLLTTFMKVGSQFMLKAEILRLDTEASSGGATARGDFDPKQGLEDRVIEALDTVAEKIAGQASEKVEVEKTVAIQPSEVPDSGRLSTTGNAEVLEPVLPPMDEESLARWANSFSVQHTFAHTDDVQVVEFSPDGSLLATADEDDYVNIFNAQSGQAILQHRLMATMRTLAFSPDGAMLAAGGADKSLLIFSVGTPRDPMRMQPRSDVLFATFSPDSKHLAVVREDAITVFETRGGSPVAEIAGQGPVAWVSSDSLLVATNIAWTSLIDLNHNKVQMTYSADANTFEPQEGSTLLNSPMQVDPTRRFFTVTSAQGAVNGSHDAAIFVISSGRHVMVSHSDNLYLASFSPDGRLLAIGDQDDVVRIWDAETAKPVWQLEDLGYTPWPIWVLGGRVLAILVWKAGGTLRFWRPDLKWAIRTFDLCGEVCCCQVDSRGHAVFAFSPKGNAFAVGCSGQAAVKLVTTPHLPADH